jgi:ribonuclease HI
MIIFSWNCRGLGNPWAVRDLCRLVKDKKPDLVFLMETKLRRKKMEIVRNKLGFPNMFTVECIGRSGGLGLLWRDEAKVEVQNFSQRHINAIIFEPLVDLSWKFTGFYGHPEAPRRYEAWELLKFLARTAPSPWLVIGDFNEIVNGTEKWGGNTKPRWQMQAFQQTLEECNLTDLGFRGSKYTWSNCRDGVAFIKERLDRGVANMEWRAIFPDALVNVEAAVSSDHTPLALSLKKFTRRKKRRKSTKYESVWALEEGYKDVITSAWKQEMINYEGWDRVEYKLETCMKNLVSWRTQAHGQNRESIPLMRDKLAKLQGSDDMGNNEEIQRLKTEIQVQLEREDLWWRQRAKQEWLKNGDKNTHFFHACANSRRKKNFIEKIRDEQGNWGMSMEEVNGAFINYFTKLFSAGRVSDQDPCFQTVESRVTRRMNEELLEEFTGEEISRALFQMAPLKAPGPDGFNASFFQQNWAILGEEISRGILNIFNSGILPHNLNSTLIALIPKCENPECVNEFRPISLCNVMYKLVSKVLANRLKKVLPHIISPTQSAFIPGRLITDNILAAYETLHTMHTGMRGKKGYMAIKLDMSKAYDRVEWSFLEGVMRHMGFAERWIQLVMMCVTTVKYSVVINGEPCGHITPTRGIRQGDPISPYLFLLCAEVLSSMVSKANREGLLTGVPTSKRGPKISHLFFADDSLLFCRSNIAHWSNLTAILNSYEKASGQKLNSNKTSIFFSKNTPTEDKEIILEFAGIPATSRYDKYLGLPAMVGRSRMKAFKNITERVWKRLQDWKLKLLSQAGKEILLKAVIQAIPSYCMGIFLLPKSLCSELHSLMARFWWGHKENEKKIAWMSWSKMGVPKECGGMGFRDLSCFNKALLAKQVWRLWTTPESLVARIIKAKYHPDCSILEAPLRAKPSFAWRSIQGSCALIKEGLVWRIGNGKKAKIWGDKWLPNHSTYQVQSPPSVIEENATVSHLIDERDHVWKPGLLNRIFSAEERELIYSIPISTTEQEDRQIWRGNARGTFSVKSAYYIQKEWELSQGAESSTQGRHSKIWKKLWKLQLPNVEKLCFWRACQNILPTRENLCRRKVITDPSCPVCGLEEETICHVLWQCPAARDVWSGGCIKVQKCNFEDSDFLRVAEGILEKCELEEFQNFVAIVRRLWLRRNDILHGGSFTSPATIILKAKVSIQEFQEAQQKQISTSRQPGTVQWTPINPGHYKVNWDAAVEKRTGRIGLGAVIRDHQGELVAARCVTYVGLLEPTAAEAVAATMAIRLAHDRGYRQVHLVGDAKVIIDAVMEEVPNWSRVGHLVDDIRAALQLFLSWKMTYVRREGNQPAHLLARMATTSELDREWNCDFPEELRETCASELT